MIDGPGDPPHRHHTNRKNNTPEDWGGDTGTTYAAEMDVDAVIAALGTRFDAEESAIIERMLREHAGTVPDRQLLEEIGLALAIHRRQG